MVTNGLFSLFAQPAGGSKRNVLLVSFVLLFVLVLLAAPQFAVWACSGTGSCPCPGC
jgi:hypothetical protein